MYIWFSRALISDHNYGKEILDMDDIQLYKVRCDYCHRTIYALWDKYNQHKWSPYIGNSALRNNVYKYSEAIQRLRSGKYPITVDDLMNSHARVHTEPAASEIRYSRNNIRILCNEDFHRTFKRQLVEGEADPNYYYSTPGIRKFAISVMDNETLDQVANEMHIIIHKKLGRGSVAEYN